MTNDLDRKMSLKTIFIRNIEYIKYEKIKVIIALILIILNILLEISLPLILSYIINLLEETIKFKYILVLVISYLSISIINQAIYFIYSMLMQYAGQNIVYRLRNKVFSHIELLSQNQFDNFPVGALTTRVVNYTQSMSDLFTNDLVKFLKNLLKVIGVYAIMMAISYKLGLIMLVFIVILLVVSIIFSRVSAKIFRIERKNISKMNSYLNENLSGMKITQLFNQEDRKNLEFIETTEDLRKSRMKVVKSFALYRPFVTLLYYLSLAVIFYVGIKINLTAGEIVAFYLYTSNFFNPIEEMTDQLNNFNKAFTASERLFNILDVKPQVRDRDNAIEVKSFKGKIEFRNVWFSYNENEWVLKDVSFIINPLETIAFVGATGCGKSTILNLIVRNYEIQKGSILIDDIDINDIKLSSLRSGIGQMLQDVFMFSGTIKTNINLHDDTYSDKEINDVCDYVNASSFINKLPDKLYHEVIERGSNLSAGERQLISFSRTVLHKPQILILDEATANIDTQTESIIQESLEKMKNIGTMLIVAHRLQTIKNASRIIVLNKGHIIESGSHDELMDIKGYYYKLYELQFKM